MPAYGKTVWSRPSSLRSSTCGGGTGVNRRGAGEFRKATEATRIRLRGEHGISRPTIAQGRPSVRRHLYAAVRSSLRYIFAQRTAGARRHPVFPAPSSKTEGNADQQNSGVQCRENACSCLLFEDEMVLPDRIELSTSPLPMECSTTELRQHVLGSESAARGAYQAGRYLPQASPLCKLARPAKTRKSGRYRGYYGCFRRKRPRFVDFWSLTPANWPVGRCGGFGPFWISHDRDIRAS